MRKKSKAKGPHPPPWIRRWEHPPSLLHKLSLITRRRQNSPQFCSHSCISLWDSAGNTNHMHTIATDVTSSTKEARISHNCDPCSYFAVFITSPIAYTYNKNEKQHERSFCRHLHSRESWKKGGGNQCHFFRHPHPTSTHPTHTQQLNHYYLPTSGCFTFLLRQK